MKNALHILLRLSLSPPGDTNDVKPPKYNKTFTKNRLRAVQPAQSCENTFTPPTVIGRIPFLSVCIRSPSIIVCITTLPGTKPLIIKLLADPCCLNWWQHWYLYWNDGKRKWRVVYYLSGAQGRLIRCKIGIQFHPGHCLIKVAILPNFIGWGVNTMGEGGQCWVSPTSLVNPKDSPVVNTRCA